MKYTKKLIVALAVLACAISLSPAQEGVLTWLAFAQVSPGQSQAYQTLMKDFFGGPMQAGMKDGSILSWGLAEKLNHGGEASHFLWVTVKDWNDMQDVFDAVGAATEADPQKGVEMTQNMGSIADMSAHFDSVVRHRVHHFTIKDPAPKYFRAGNWKAMPGKSGEVNELYDEYVKPIYDKLLKDGVVRGYGVHTPELHQAGTPTHVGWIAVTDLGQLEKVTKALEALQSNEDFGKRFGAAMTPDTHFDDLWMILHAETNEK